MVVDLNVQNVYCILFDDIESRTVHFADACSSSPCGDTGNCTVTVDDPGFVCTCIDGFSGMNCSIYGIK